jgi:hypothetical protein
MNGRGDEGSDRDAIKNLSKTEAIYKNGSQVAILAASSTGVRGPHVPSLKLDELDEIPSEIRDSALGMAMQKGGIRSSVLMTSTWHRLSGPMTSLIERAKGGEFPSTLTASSRYWSAAPPTAAANTSRTAPSDACRLVS